MAKTPEGWTPDTQMIYMDRVLAEMDARYEGRYVSTVDHVQEVMDLHRAALVSQIEAVEKSLQAALSAEQRAVAAALASQQRAVDLAEQMAQRWRDQANEWRGTVQDQNRQFSTVVYVEGLEKRVDKLEKGHDESRGAVKYLTTFVSLAVSVVVIVSTIIIIMNQ